ncbi:hypothetical protein SAMN05421858_2481 [Haladaptatus litoreus]|uniref:Uncharacterized protein n=1 Tax=Haladaptatus litoreus TaxID=553468 RepID=A0A1N7BCX6_9EURY|nr:hypothetical protein [Haladaptatus litoreus]SIR49114.1 hypothetical protein SAMN05421858_2481 [Haladaptatus litoreus]
MGTIAVLAVALLVAAATGLYRVFSYLAALFIVANFGVASIERNDGELNLAPYSPLLLGLGAVFTIGFTIIWLQWNPSVTEYTYVLGLPIPTLAYFGFLWLLPILGAFYYAFAFPKIGSDDVVDDIMTDVRQVQRRKRFPLSAAPAEADGAGTSGEVGTSGAAGRSKSADDASSSGESATTGDESPQATGGDQ